MPKIVLFNGPPRSGKDTATRFAMEYFGKRAVHYRFAGPLKDAVHGLFGLPGIMQEHFDSVKDIPQELFFGMSPREAYIWLSENAVKPKFGKTFFANVAVNNLSRITNDSTVIISDCGFFEEVDALIKAFGKDNVAIVYLKRTGTSFDGDSRNYVTHVDCKQYAITNDVSLVEFNEKIIDILREFRNAR